MSRVVEIAAARFDSIAHRPELEQALSLFRGRRRAWRVATRWNGRRHADPAARFDPTIRQDGWSAHWRCFSVGMEFGGLVDKRVIRRAAARHGEQGAWGSSRRP